MLIAFPLAVAETQPQARRSWITARGPYILRHLAGTEAIGDKLPDSFG
jgi:hypothetical protein